MSLQYIKVFTDNNPLTYILTTAKLDATGQRWVSALSEFNFDITYRAGLKNGDADAMSRYPHECVTLKDITQKVEIKDSTIKAVCCINNSIVQNRYLLLKHYTVTTLT